MIFENYYYIIPAIQGFCLFHSYKNNTFQKWVFIIIFIPLIGSLIYLYDAFYNRRNISGLNINVKRMVNANYEIEVMERELKIADTISNRINLANAYLESGNYKKALDMYNQSMTGNYENDPSLKMKKLKTLYLLDNFEEAILIGESLHKHKPFDQSEEKIALANAYAITGKIEMAELTFQSMNFQNCNYKHRVEFGKFLIKINKIDQAKSHFKILESELELMGGFEKKINTDIAKEVRDIMKRY